MKIITMLLTALSLVFVSITATAAVSPELAIGNSAPSVDLKLTDISGKVVSLSDVKKENGLLVIFSCNTCPYVIACEDRYLQLSALCKSNKIGLILVNSNEAKRDGDDSIAEMKAHAKKYKYNFTYAEDPNSMLADAFGATRTPHVFLFDKDMKLQYRGAVDDSVIDASKVEKSFTVNAITALVAGKEISPASTKSIGCGIKRK